jgi:hypothetical protein
VGEFVQLLSKLPIWPLRRTRQKLTKKIAVVCQGRGTKQLCGSRAGPRLSMQPDGALWQGKIRDQLGTDRCKPKGEGMQIYRRD